jgi:hypothetical protein
MAIGRLQLNKLQKAKIGAHALQALFTFIALCVLIAMFAQKGKTDGRAKWYLALASLMPCSRLHRADFWTSSAF